ncbi:interleukin-12 receptor subunit beta-2-like isoform X2 [Mustelus asterias]
MRIVFEVLLVAAVLIQHVKQTDPPQDLFCFRLDKNSAVTCSWSPCADTQIPTNYIFFIQEKGSIDLIQISTCLTSLTLGRKNFTAGRTYVAWVKANKTQRKDCLTRLEFIIDDIVKPLAPADVSGEHILEAPTAIGISWRKPSNLDPFIKLQFRLQFREAGNRGWNEVSRDEIGIHATHYELEGLQPFTSYEFRIQCAKEGERNRMLWSDWSPVARARTGEDLPVGYLDVWFVQQLTTSDGLVAVMVLWKPLERHQARGTIHRYSVSYLDGEVTKNATVNICCNISLPGTTRLVNVTAYNSIGATQPAKLNLIQDHPAPFNMTVHSVNRSLLVSWEPPTNTTPDGFVVEWRRMNSERIPNWKKISAANACVTLIDGVLAPLLLYKVSVYARYQGGLGGPVSTLVYTEEGVPLAGPKISILNISHTGVTLLWKALPTEQRQGFVQYYTLYSVEKPRGEDRHKALNISYTANRYTLLHLEPDTTYRIWMTASTSVGEGRRGPYLNFKTKGSQVALWMLVFVLLGSGLVGIITFLSCRHCQQRIQSCSSFYLPPWCYQRIPDPRNSRVGHQLHHYNPNDQSMMEEPDAPKVEEIENEDNMQVPVTNSDKMQVPVMNSDKVQVPLSHSDNSTLTSDRGPSTEDQYWTKQPSPAVDNPQEVSNSVDERPVDQAPSSTRLMGGVPFTSGYEKHFMPSEEVLLNDEWQLENRDDWLGKGDITDDFSTLGECDVRESQYTTSAP